MVFWMIDKFSTKEKHINKEWEGSFIPRVGDKIDWLHNEELFNPPYCLFTKSFPKIIEVILYPSSDCLRKYDINLSDDAIAIILIG